MIQKTLEIIKRANGSNILGIGVAIPGPFIRSEGKIGLMSEFPGWEDISIEEELSSRFGLPTYMEHDANVGALAECWLGPNPYDIEVMAYVSAGQGVGAGIMHRGKLFTGAFGIAGEIGHTSISYDGRPCECGNRGCLELYCSTIALLKEIKHALSKGEKSILSQHCTLDDVLSAVNAGDELAVRIFDDTARFLGIGIINVIYTYNPSVIIIGDELSKAGQRLLDIVSHTVKQHVLPRIYKDLSIQLSTFQTDPILLGAGLLVIDNLQNIIPNK